MVRITEELVRKKSEHNELMISTLEELSLHQEDIEKIEHLQNWCRGLKILLLQSNLISRIENLSKLKNLQYLNLALNNIERIENLECLESLEKLDLTLNFIGELSSVKSLCSNYNLKNLILTGNPCTDYNGYHSYVISVLPQLAILDGVEIKPSNRIKAEKEFEMYRENILDSEIKYKMRRDIQKIRVAKQKLQFEEEMKDSNEEERMKRFWNTKSENCPETRCDLARFNKEGKKDSSTGKEELPKPMKLFSPSGRPYNMNQPKIKFTLEDEDDFYGLNLEVHKFLDTSQIEVDVQPKYVRVTVKKKVFQMELGCEVKPSASTCKRSEITGHLLISMPKLSAENISLEKTKESTQRYQQAKIQANNKGTVDYRNICQSPTTCEYEGIPGLI